MNESHPGDDALVAHALGELEEEDRVAIESHVDACDSCRAAIVAFTRVMNGVRGVRRPDAPMRVLVDLLEAQAGSRRERRRVSGLWIRRAAPVLAAVAMLFAAGFWAGRQSAPSESISRPGSVPRPVAERRLPVPPRLGFETATPLEASLQLSPGPPPDASRSTIDSPHVSDRRDSL